MRLSEGISSRELSSRRQVNEQTNGWDGESENTKEKGPRARWSFFEEFLSWNFSNEKKVRKKTRPQDDEERTRLDSLFSVFHFQWIFLCCLCCFSFLFLYSVAVFPHPSSDIIVDFGVFCFSSISSVFDAGKSNSKMKTRVSSFF